MEEGTLLHIFPVINQGICVECGACKQACPVENPIPKVLPLKTYAAWAKDSYEYETSTSGGVAAVLSRVIIKEGGVVYGCASLPNVDIHHIRITDEKDIDLLKGSKYVQSSINESYKSVKQDLLDGRQVLFTGTPCQIAGLKRFLRKDYSNLYLVDLICHGVPSLEYLKQHIKDVTHCEAYDIDRISFREGNEMYLVVVKKNGEEVYRSNLWKERYKDAYFNAFIDGYSYRPSCHTCQYAYSKRISDITIGDFWGLHDDLPLEHKNGTSCVLVNTEKGLELISRITSQIHIFERELQEAVNGNDQLRAPKGTDWRIKLFLKLQKHVGISTAYRICEIDHSTPKVNGLSRIIERLIKKRK